MAKVIIYTNPDAALGNVCVCNPAPGVDINLVLKKDVPPGVTAHIVEESTLPADDMDFFNAWKLTLAGAVPQVAVHMPTARTMTHATINRLAIAVAHQRLLHTAIGVAVDGAHLPSTLAPIRAAVDAATTTAHLRDAIAKVPAS